MTSSGWRNTIAYSGTGDRHNRVGRSPLTKSARQVCGQASRLCDAPCVRVKSATPTGVASSICHARGWSAAIRRAQNVDTVLGARERYGRQPHPQLWLDPFATPSVSRIESKLPVSEGVAATVKCACWATPTDAADTVITYVYIQPVDSINGVVPLRTVRYGQTNSRMSSVFCGLSIRGTMDNADRSRLLLA